MRTKIITLLFLSINLWVFGQKINNEILFKDKLLYELIPFDITIDNIDVKHQLKKVKQVSTKEYDATKNNELYSTSTYFLTKKKLNKHVFLFEDGTGFNDERNYSYNTKNQLTKIDIVASAYAYKIYFEYQKEQLTKILQTSEEMDNLTSLFQYKKDQILILKNQDSINLKTKNGNISSIKNTTYYGIVYDTKLQYNAKNQMLELDRNTIASRELVKNYKETFTYNKFGFISSKTITKIDKAKPNLNPKITNYKYEYLYDTFNNWSAKFEIVMGNNNPIKTFYLRNIKYTKKTTEILSLDNPKVVQKIKEIHKKYQEKLPNTAVWIKKEDGIHFYNKGKSIDNDVLINRFGKDLVIFNKVSFNTYFAKNVKKETKNKYLSLELITKKGEMFWFKKENRLIFSLNGKILKSRKLETAKNGRDVIVYSEEGKPEFVLINANNTTLKKIFRAESYSEYIK